MPARLHCLTLPVDHLQASILFYRDGLGLEWEDKEDHAVFWLSPDVLLMVLPRQRFGGYVELAGQETASGGSSGIIMTYFASSEEEVDSLLEQALEYGSSGQAAVQRPWGYSGYVCDPDGHIWEVLHFSPALSEEPAGEEEANFDEDFSADNWDDDDPYADDDVS